MTNPTSGIQWYNFRPLGWPLTGEWAPREALFIKLLWPLVLLKVINVLIRFTVTMVKMKGCNIDIGWRIQNCGNQRQTHRYPQSGHKPVCRTSLVTKIRKRIFVYRMLFTDLYWTNWCYFPLVYTLHVVIIFPRTKWLRNVVINGKTMTRRRSCSFSRKRQIHW